MELEGRGKPTSPRVWIPKARQILRSKKVDAREVSAPDAPACQVRAAKVWQAVDGPPELRISDLHIQQYLEHGFVVIKDVFTPDELARMQAECDTYYPTYDDWVSGGRRIEPRIRAPFKGPTLMANVSHPALVSAAARILDREVGDITWHQSNLSVKYSGTQAECDTNSEQSLHSDIAAHDLAYPSPDRRYWQVEFVIYLDAVDSDEFGPTKAVSWQHTKDVCFTPKESRTREERPDLYEKEAAVIAPAGSVLIYNMRTMHRGTAIRAQGSRRRVHFVTWGPTKGAAPWLGYEGQTLPAKIFSPYYRDLLLSQTPEQRALFGFPPVDSPYWCEETLRGVAARYPGMDMTPYSEAVARRETRN